MIEQSVSLASNGSVQVPGYEHLARFGYTKTGACTALPSPLPASGRA